MNDELVLLFEDNPTICDRFEKLFVELKIELKLKVYNKLEDFKKAICGEENYEKIRVLILDLAKDKDEERKQKFEIESLIDDNYHKNRIPIFIHSGFIKLYINFDGKGSVFKIEKSSDSILKICNKIKLMEESGFLNIFCIRGFIERKIMEELHKAFTEQFKNNDIENIIESIKKITDTDKFSDRIKKVFKRIAIRSLLTELLSPDIDEKGEVIEEFLSSTEHYIRRINKIVVWTGDIFKNKKTDDYIFILTPRCNVLRNKQILCCPFQLGEIIKKEDKISKMLQGDPTVSGYNRFLPPSPIFKGGKLVLANHKMIDKEDISNNYERIITLSDELTNEILGKFGSYFFRSGITPWEEKEITANIKNKKYT